MMDTPIKLHQQDFTLFFLVTILAFIGTFISPVIKWIVKICHRPSSTERQLLKDVNDLKADLNKISMVDEFAKHAKIQRKINKLTGELEAIQKNKNWSQISITYGAIIGAKVLHAFVVLIVNFKHRYTPVLLVPKELFYPWYPLGFIMSFPTGVEGMFTRALT